MTRFRFAALTLCLLAAGCKDTRRDLAQAYVLAHPPEGFEVAVSPKDIPVKNSAEGTGEALVSVRYRLLRSTVDIGNGFALPRGRELADQLGELRGWALGALPASDSPRESILAAVAKARAAFPVKRVVTPAGTEVDALVTLQLQKAGADWKVTGFKADATVPGSPDADATIPFENAPEVAARFDQLAATIKQLELTRSDYLAQRARRAAESLAKLRAHFQTGRTFEGSLPDGTAVRVVISHGLDGNGAAIVVLTTRAAAGESTARFTGGLVQQSSGDTAWRAAKVSTLSVPTDGIVSVTDATARPVLTLFAAGAGLDARVEIAGRAPELVTLRPAPSIDLIPDPAQNPAVP